MSTIMKRYNILLSCPSDVQNQMTNIDAILEDVNHIFEFDGIYFCLKHWSKDVLFGYGTPQVKINTQIVSDADAVVALFGMRLGTATEHHESGTVEEIKILANSGKQVFVFFSKTIDADADIEELMRVKEFKKEYSCSGLYKEYTSGSDLKEKLFRQLILYGNNLKHENNEINKTTFNENASHVFIKNRDNVKAESDIIRDAKHELFVSGISLISWAGYASRLESRTDLIIRLLCLNMCNVELIKAYTDMRGFSWLNQSVLHLKRLLAYSHIEIREIDFITPVLFVATDIDKADGYIKAEHIFNYSRSVDYMNIELTPRNKEWYDNYRNQIENVWNQGTPWKG